MFQQDALIAEMDKLHKFARRLTKNPAHAEDLLQCTLLRALEKKDYFEAGTNLFSWTSRMMFNLFISDYRSKKKFETQYDPAYYIDRMSVEPTQEAHVDLIAVTAGMNLLSHEHREVLQLICAQQMRYEEAAELLGIPVGTVRSRLSRARSQLQEMMSPATRPVAALPVVPDLHPAIMALPLAASVGARA